MRIRYPFAGAFAVLILFSAYIGLTPLVISSINDKVLHFTIFFLLTVTLYWAIDLPRRLVMKLVFGASVALALASELVQAGLPNGREFDTIDIAANLVGSTLALALCAWYHKRMLERKRRRKLDGYGLVGTAEDGDDVELGEGSREGQENGVVAEDDDDDGGEAWDDIGGGDAAEEEENDDNKKPQQENGD